MVAPRYRSRSKKRKHKTTPSGRQITHYERKKTAKHKCGRCGKALSGTPSDIPSRIRKMTRSQRVPERPYSGILCTTCTESLERYVTKFEVKSNYPDFSDMELKRDLTIEKFLPKGWYQNISK